MGRLVNTTTMTVDGVIDVGDWFVAGGDHDRAARDDFDHAAAMLLGRKTYEGLAGYWSPLDDEWATVLNAMPKYVASRTLQRPLEWNATLIEGDVGDGVARLKDELEGDLVLVGCGELARSLVERGLVDEARFWIHPALEGYGTRAFEGGRVRLRLAEARPFDSGVTLLRYELG